MNDVGRIVADEWLITAEMRPEIELDEWAVMPNHFHGILVIGTRRGTARRAPTMGLPATMGHAATMTREQFGKPVACSVPTIVRSFKSAVTKGINAVRRTPGANLWQRNYWEHIIRDESDSNRIREYIRNNPSNWGSDALNEVR